MKWFNHSLIIIGIASALALTLPSKPAQAFFGFFDGWGGSGFSFGFHVSSHGWGHPYYGYGYYPYRYGYYGLYDYPYYRPYPGFYPALRYPAYERQPVAPENEQLAAK